MPLTPFDQDPESEGSRFTLHPAVAIYGVADHDADAEASLRSVLGDDVLTTQEGLGSAASVPGGVGRGADGWAAVVEWAAIVVLGGIIQGAAWDGTKAAGRALLALVRRNHLDGKLLVSRGAAALLAVEYVAQLAQAESVMFEAVEEPSSIAGHRSPEMNYVGIEPWVVFVVDPQRRRRYVVVIRSDGELMVSMGFPLEEFERDHMTTDSAD